MKKKLQVAGKIHCWCRDMECPARVVNPLYKYKNKDLPYHAYRCCMKYKKGVSPHSRLPQCKKDSPKGIWI